MTSNETRRAPRALALTSLAALALTGLAATPATAAPGTGSATLTLAAQKKGKALNAQGVKVLALAPATKSGKVVALPISAVEPGAQPAALADGSLRFKKGKRTVNAGGLRFDVGAGTLRGTLGKAEVDILRLPAPGTADAATGAVSLGGKLKLTGAAASVLKKKLALDKSPAGTALGGLALSAKASPLRESRAVVSGSLGWGMLASWRGYVLSQIGPAPPNKGTIEIGGGATATGNLDNPATTYAFPATSGTYEKGLYGATDKLSLTTQGSLVFRKPGHCIIEIELADLAVTLDGASSSLVVGDFGYDIDQFNGAGCTDIPAVLAPGTEFAKLDPSGVVPVHSGDGKTVTWADVPATLTAAGSAPFAPTYEAGEALDPVTITVSTG